MHTGKPRVICVLLWDARSLIKTRCFSEDRRLGPLAQALGVMSARDVDEILLLDVGASRSGREFDLELCAEAASMCSVPLTVGGGIRDLSTAKLCLGHGADRVALTSAALKKPWLINEMAENLGSSNLVVGIDYRGEHGAEWCYADSGRTRGEIPLRAWVREVSERGAGEVVLHSIERDGTLGGMDVALGEEIAGSCNRPVVLVGGLGSASDASEALRSRRIAGVGVGAAFHFTELTPNVIREQMRRDGLPTRRTAGLEAPGVALGQPSLAPRSRS